VDALQAMNEAELHALMVRGLAGDAGAHRALLESLAAHLRTYVRRRLFSDPDAAEDIVQEILLGVHLKRHTFDVSQPLTAWVHAITRFKMIDHLRRMGRRGRSASLEEAEFVLAETDAETGLVRRDLDRLLARLPEKQRRSIQLVKLEQKSIREVAAGESMSETDVKVSIHRGMKKLSKLVIMEDPQ
jgi:RNA polymerase sigma-70 factor (ECF subfamily)